VPAASAAPPPLPAPSDVEGIVAYDVAATLLRHPVRRRILALATEPRSAAEVARELGEPRQKVTYHVNRLAAVGLLRPADRRPRRNLVEQRYVASARAYVLAPQVLGAAAPGEGAARDSLSAAHVLALAGRAQAELSQMMADAARLGRRLPTLSLDAEVAFASAAQRAAFTDALTSAIARVIAEHSVPAAAAGSPEAPTARRYRLFVGSYPIPAPSPPEAES